MSAKPLVLILGRDPVLDQVLSSCDVRITREEDSDFDLILLDVDELSPPLATHVDECRRRFRERPMILVGQPPSPSDLLQLGRLGVHDWVERPLVADHLHRSVESALLVWKIQQRGQDQTSEASRRQGESTADRDALHRRLASLSAELEVAHAQLAAAHRELQGRVAQLVMLYRIGRDLSVQPNWDAALSRFLESLREFLGAQGVALLLTSQGGQLVQARRVNGLGEATVTRACDVLAQRKPGLQEPYLYPLEELNREQPVPCVDQTAPWDHTVLPLRHRERDLGFLLIEKPYTSGEAIGDDVYFLITVQSILTEEVAGAQAISELRKLQQFQERTLDQIESGIVTLDDEGRLLYINRKGRELLQDPDLGEALTLRLRMGGEPVDLYHWAQEGQSGQPVVGQGWILPRGGDPWPVSLRASRIAAEMPGEYHSIVILEDEGAVRELEAERRRAARQDELLIMAAEWAHDVRTPLTGILHGAELLCEAVPAGSAKRRHLDVVRGEVDRINGLVSNFLDFARPVRLKRSPTQLERLAAQTVELVAPLAAQGDVSLHMQPWPGALPALDADGDQLKQVLLNLVTNAVEASPSGGEVRVKIELATAPLDSADGALSEPALVLRVEDEGPGVAPEHRDRLFIPFFTTKPEGTGLGLAISEKIIRAHRGQLRYERRGDRTMMRAVFPISKTAAPPPGTAEVASGLKARG